MHKHENQSNKKENKTIQKSSNSNQYKTIEMKGKNNSRNKIEGLTSNLRKQSNEARKNWIVKKEAVLVIYMTVRNGGINGKSEQKTTVEWSEVQVKSKLSLGFLFPNFKTLARLDTTSYDLQEITLHTLVS